jgi:hypothetical protein
MAREDEARMTRLKTLLDQLNEACRTAEALRVEVEQHIVVAQKRDLPVRNLPVRRRRRKRKRS